MSTHPNPSREDRHKASVETINHLAFLVCQARPQWDLRLVQVVLLNHADQVDGTDLAIAALRCAKISTYPTPKAIGWRGPHWDGLDTVPEEIRKPDRCYTCGKPEPLCYGVRFQDDDHRFETLAQVEALAESARQRGPRKIATRPGRVAPVESAASQEEEPSP